ncbi:hypothetical protein [Lysobacter niastensis]
MKRKPRIPLKQIRKYQDMYSAYADSEFDHLRGVAHLTPAQLYEICRWKSKRRPELALGNSKELVKEITAFAFSAKCEESRIGVLTLLDGVSFPTASVILHFCVSRSYPILDFRALWSLGIEKPAAYSARFWIEYVECCRNMARDNGLSVRSLDKALWQYSREHKNK